MYWPILLLLAHGGGSPSNHHSGIMNSPLISLQHTSDIRVELGIQEHIMAESKKFNLLRGQGGTSNRAWEKCSIKILILEQTFIT